MDNLDSYSVVAMLIWGSCIGSVFALFGIPGDSKAGRIFGFFAGLVVGGFIVFVVESIPPTGPQPPVMP